MPARIRLRSGAASREQLEGALERTLGPDVGRPWVTIALIAANCGVFLYLCFAGAGPFETWDSLVAAGANWGPVTLDHQWWRLLTESFLHFTPAHLALNMWTLWVFGRTTEPLLGSAAFLWLYVFCALCASLTSLFCHPQLICAGAAGAIFGVLGARFAVMLSPAARVPFAIARYELSTGIVFVGYSALHALMDRRIDVPGHIGGLVAGFALGLVLARPLDPQARADTASRLPLGVLLGSLVIVGGWWPLAYPPPSVLLERPFRAALARFELDWDALIRLRRELVSTAAQPWHDPTEFERNSAALEGRWQAHLQHVTAPPLPVESPLRSARDALLAYLQEEQLGLQRLAVAVHDQDQSQVQAARQALSETDAHRRTLQQWLWDRNL
jgi:rhomboid protease GluP